MELRRTIATGLAALAVSFPGCKPPVYPNPNNYELRKALASPSYKLEDLCEGEITPKEIKINVYIQHSEILWDYQNYKEEMFGYVKDFFTENSINCEIVYSEAPFSHFQGSREFGVEILDSSEKMKERYIFLLTGMEFDEKEAKIILDMKGYAATRAGIALINGGFEEFRDMIKSGDMSIKEVEEQYPETYKGVTKKEYLFKGYAANICHELMHCMTLFHTNNLRGIVEDYTKGVPNIMTYKNPNFTQENTIGYCLTFLQKKMIHNFISGGNNHHAFVDSLRELDIYLGRVERENNLVSEQKH